MVCSDWVLWGIVACVEGVVCNECILVIVRCQIVCVCVFAEELVLLMVLVGVGVWGCLGLWGWEVLLVQSIARRRRSVSWLGRGGRKGLALALPMVWLVAVAAVVVLLPSSLHLWHGVRGSMRAPMLVSVHLSILRVLVCAFFACTFSFCGWWW